ncbi:hypothetical protein C8A01DRAFT_47787 [Parachaetomium inaequale]|uniref:Uncharacterized protein n=1 Tax=Parachaetomium inaequale TaxID=2588326 RepID=A0AAN6PEN1_9PEZI|nr:hypothetical protein C8A01DRAFT_47787 [Parachaetomium inaequale]
MPSLQALPLELVGHIAESLCPHCTPPPSCQCSAGCLAVSPNSYCPIPAGASPSETNGRISALGALCLTSRRLNSAAAHHLYHYPNTTRWWLLADTLIRRPGLAQHVKRLYFPDSLDKPEDESAVEPQVLSFHKAQHDTYMASVTEERRRWLFISSRPGDLGNLLSGPDGTSNQVSLAVIRYDYLLHFSSPLSMLALHTVELAYDDIEGGFPLSSLVPLFRAAPNLSVIRCDSMSEDLEDGDDLGVALEKAKRLELLRSAISAYALGVLLRVCPGLEMFKYEAGGAVTGAMQFNPSEARDLMMEHGGRLKRVVMDLTHGHECWDFSENGWVQEEKGEVEEAFKEKGIEFELIGI